MRGPGGVAGGGARGVWREEAVWDCELSDLRLVVDAGRKNVSSGGELATAAEVRVAMAPEEHGAA